MDNRFATETPVTTPIGGGWYVQTTDLTPYMWRDELNGENYIDLKKIVSPGGGSANG